MVSTVSGVLVAGACAAVRMFASAVRVRCRHVVGVGTRNPATRNRTRDHLIAAGFYSQMLYQLSYSRGGHCGCTAITGTWCSGITSAPHAEGPGFNPQCVHFRAPEDTSQFGTNRWAKLVDNWAAQLHLADWAVALVTARLVQSAGRKALNLVVAGSSPTVCAFRRSRALPRNVAHTTAQVQS